MQAVVFPVCHSIGDFPEIISTPSTNQAVREMSRLTYLEISDLHQCPVEVRHFSGWEYMRVTVRDVSRQG